MQDNILTDAKNISQHSYDPSDNNNRSENKQGEITTKEKDMCGSKPMDLSGTQNAGSILCDLFGHRPNCSYTKLGSSGAIPEGTLDEVIKNEKKRSLDSDLNLLIYLLKGSPAYGKQHTSPRGLFNPFFNEDMMTYKKGIKAGILKECAQIDGSPDLSADEAKYALYLWEPFDSHAYSKTSGYDWAWGEPMSRQYYTIWNPTDLTISIEDARTVFSLPFTAPDEANRRTLDDMAPRPNPISLRSFLLNVQFLLRCQVGDHFRMSAGSSFGASEFVNNAGKIAEEGVMMCVEAGNKESYMTPYFEKQNGYCILPFDEFVKQPLIYDRNNPFAC